MSLSFLGAIGLQHYLLLSALLFFTGFFAVLVRKNILLILMGIELMLNAASLSFVAFSRFQANLEGLVVVFFVMILAAAEVAIGLSLAVLIYRKFKRLDIDFFNKLGEND